MANWRLLLAQGKTHLVNLDAEKQELPGLGSFRSAVLRAAPLGEEFDLVGTPARLFEPTLPDLEANLSRGPQVILPRDLAWITWALALKPGDSVVEAGGGSGGLTLALARAVAPDGRVTSFEPRPAHRQVLERNLQRSPHAALIEVIPESLTPETEPRECHAVALDLPQPWELVGWAAASLAPGGRLVAYLPTTPQVAQLLRALEGWGELRVLENLQRDWEPKPQSLRPQHRMLGHTGFIVSARHFG